MTAHNKSQFRFLDRRNEAVWQKRFSDLPEKDLLTLLKHAENAEYRKGISYARLNLAAFHFYHSRNTPALKYLLESLSWFQENKEERGYVRGILLQGSILESFGDFENALTLWMEALKTSRENSDRENEGEACSQLGLIYSRFNNCKKALDFLKTGMNIREELGDENGVASSLNRIGMVLRQNREYDLSLGHYFKSLEIRKKNNQQSAVYWTYLGIANTYEDLKKYPESIDFYHRGMEADDSRCRLHCLMGSGRVFSSLCNHNEAETRLKQALDLAQQLSSEALEAEIESALADHYEKCGRQEEALRSLKKFLKLREKLHSSEIHNRISNIEVVHAIEIAEHEKEIYRLKHVELKKAFDIIEENNKYITSSINYASRIQNAMLPDKNEFRDIFRKMFILYLPKEVIGGDFYWIGRKDKKLVAAAADCTGHGVPGALMSMLCISLLHDIAGSDHYTTSGQVLNELRKEILRALHQEGPDQRTKDGMDISLCIINPAKKVLQFSGAHNDIFLVRRGEIYEYQADRMPVGISDFVEQDFITCDIKYVKGDMLYMSSDGFRDQIGGPARKRYKSPQFKELLKSVSGMPLMEQKQKIENEFTVWKGRNEQTDDVLVMGLRL